MYDVVRLTMVAVIFFTGNNGGRYGSSIRWIAIIEDPKTESSSRPVTYGSTGVPPSWSEQCLVRTRKKFKISKQNAPTLDYRINNVLSGPSNAPIRKEEKIASKRNKALPLVLAETICDACDCRSSVVLISDTTGSSAFCRVCFHNLATKKQKRSKPRQ